MPATTDSVIDGASMVLGSRKKINPPKSSTFWWIYFLPQPLLLESLIDDSKIMRKTQDEKMA